MCCDREREKAEERARQPIFTADRNDPEDMKLFKPNLNGVMSS